uniref:protein PBDC1-like n=1 Tax=Callithrix jacchus TaxID=9483 RepID=UPI00159CFAAF|nr:protein PBDC1-like [Callithrix jacchus]
MAWAMRAMQHAAVYYKLISSVDPQFLKLTKVDDQIYSEFQKNFEKLKIDVLDPEELKSESAKEKWRPFCLKFNGIVEDFNYGTLLRLDCSQGYYTEENTIFGPRIQFFAIEIARNQGGYNKTVYISVQDKEGEKEVNNGGEKRADSGEEDNTKKRGEKGADNGEEENTKNRGEKEADSGEEKEEGINREEKTDKGGDKGKKLTKTSTKVVRKLCKVYREQHSRSYVSTEPTRTTVLLAQTSLVKCKFLSNLRTLKRTSF